jgi:AcrR family transcriptional regulator
MGGRWLVGQKSTVSGGCDSISDPCAATGAAGRPLRADAQRNRARILDAAETVFASEGIEAPVDLIAEKAGVGVGTLYRHFPTKERLCEAILLDRLASLTADARALADAEDAPAAFFGFLEHFVEEGAAKRDLLVAVTGAGVEFEQAAAGIKDELRRAVGVLLHRAQDAGAVRSDVTAETVVMLIGATCHAAGHAGTTPSDALLSVVCDGLRPPGAR